MSSPSPAPAPAPPPRDWAAPAAQSEWDNFAVTLYEHPNRQGASTVLARADIGPGKAKLPGDWGGKVSSVVVKSGYEWCPYKSGDDAAPGKCHGDANRQVEVDQLADQGLDNSVDSHRIRKFCDAPAWVWLSDCDGDGAAAKVVGNCKSGTSCYSDRLDYCSQAANATQAVCTTFCGTGAANVCPASTTIEACKQAALAGQASNDAACTDEVRAAVYKKYCNTERPVPEACKGYIEKNIATSVAAIKAYCTADKLKTDVFCQRVLGKAAMRGQADELVGAFCATAEGKATPLCACYDASGVDATFKKLKDDDKARCKRRPDCTYKPCADGLKAGGAYGPDYTTLVCPMLKLCLDDAKGITFPDGTINRTIKIDAGSGCEGAASDDPGRESLDDLLSVAGIDLNKLLSGSPPAAPDNTKWWVAGGASSAVLCCICCCVCLLLLGVGIMMMSSGGGGQANSVGANGFGPM